MLPENGYVKWGTEQWFYHQECLHAWAPYIVLDRILQPLCITLPDYKLQMGSFKDLTDKIKITDYVAHFKKGQLPKSITSYLEYRHKSNDGLYG